MKKTLAILIPVLALWTLAYAENGDPPLANVENDVTTNQNQNVTAKGGESRSDSASNVNLNTTSISNYQTRTPPLTTFPPYLPYWNHGGWGTIKAYFPNGPTANDQVYETTFDPQNPSDVRELRSVLKALPHTGVLPVVGGMLNGVGVALFDKPDTYFHGRGIEIADSIVRDRRPEGKSLLVFIDSNVDLNLLGEEGYAYMGKVSVEGDPERNWDQAYKAAVAEALLWDVDILLISGGMKGVTTGTNNTFPSTGVGYSQANYSLSLLGGKAKGITEGKGKAILSAEAYRHCPQMVERRRIPDAVYDRIRARPWPTPAGDPAVAPPVPPSAEPTCPEAPAPAGDCATEAAPAPQVASPRFQAGTPLTQASQATQPSAPAWSPAVAAVVVPRPAPAASLSVPAPAPTPAPAAAPVSTSARRVEPKSAAYNGPGITMSRELYDLAGFPNDQQVGYVNIRQ